MQMPSQTREGACRFHFRRGAGTALGEVPPYAISYHAAKAGIKNAEVEEMLGVASDGGGSGGACARLPAHSLLSPSHLLPSGAAS